MAMVTKEERKLCLQAAVDMYRGIRDGLGNAISAEYVVDAAEQFAGFIARIATNESGRVRDPAEVVDSKTEV